MLESIGRQVKLPRNRNPCVLAPLRHCVDATSFFSMNGPMSRSLASSLGTEVCALAHRSLKRCWIRAFCTSVSVPRHPATRPGPVILLSQRNPHLPRGRRHA